MVDRAEAATYEWKQMASNPFSGYTPRAMKEYGNVYTGTDPVQAWVWSSADGASWNAVVSNDFGDGDANNAGVYAFEEFNGDLYAGTCHDTTGTELWQTSDGTSWTKANLDGFSDMANDCTYALTEFSGYLYAAVRNIAGIEIWRSNLGTPASWSAVAATGEPGASHANGFGDVNNDEAYTLTSFGGSLYAGTNNTTTGAEVWRTTDGTSWTQVNSDGFGNAGNTNARTLVSFGGYLYAGIDNVGGSELRRTSNGTTWSLIDTGFGDTNNTGIYSAAQYRGELFMGTLNLTTGAEIWKSDDGAIWRQVNSDGFSSSNNVSANVMEALGDTLLVGTSHSVNSSEVRAESPSTVSSVTGAQSTNGDGEVTVSFTVDDEEDADWVRARVEYNVGGGWQKATISATDVDTTAATGDPKVNNSDYFQVGSASGYIDASAGANLVTTIWESQTDEPTADTSSAQVRVLANDQIIDGDYASSATFDLDNVAPIVSASPAGGTYAAPQSITLTANESPVTIYYTDDGSSPTTSSSAYASAISVSAIGTTALKFFGVDDKGNQSTVVTETYIITSAPPSISLTKTSAVSAAPAPKITSNDTYQIIAAGSLLNKIGGLFKIDDNSRLAGVKIKFIEVNYLALIISLLLVFFILKFPGPEKILVRLPATRFLLVLLFFTGLTSLVMLSVLTNAKQTRAASSTTYPESILTYRLNYSNVGGENALDVYIVDAIPTYTTFIPGSLDLNGKLKTDALDTDTADYNGTNKGKATFKIGTITVGSSGYVSFKVKVNDNAPMGGVIANQGKGAFNPGNVAFQSNTVRDTVVATGLISGFVFYDANNNGARDGGDFGISGANVKLYEDVDSNGLLDTSKDILVHTKSSASNGSYTFTGLSARYYLINVDGLQPSYKLTTGNMPGQVVLTTSIQQYTKGDFGYYAQPKLPVTPPIVGGKKDDDYTPISRLPVDKVIDYVDNFLPDKEPEKVKRPEKLEESDDLKRPQKEETIKDQPLIVQEILSWWGKLKNANKNYVTSALFLLALLNFLLGVPLSILLSYLHYLAQFFTEPLLFFGKKKRREWGVVYDSLTKQPIDLALVRLFDQETNKLVETRVTDAVGRFLFIVEPEKSYYLTADKPYYAFPSRYLAGKKADASYHDLYYGELISAVSDKELEKTGHIAVNIPLDPLEGYVFDQAHPRRPIKTPIRNLRDAATLPAQQVQREDQRILHSHWWRKVNQIAAYSGPILGLIGFVVTPSWLTFIFLLLHIILLVLFNRLALGKSIKPWGKVFNVANQKSLSRSVVRIFDIKYGKLLLTTVSKSDGRYGFLVGQETYSLIPFKEGYKFPPQKVEIIGTKERVVRKDLGMEKGS